MSVGSLLPLSAMQPAASRAALVYGGAKPAQSSAVDSRLSNGKRQQAADSHRSGDCSPIYKLTTRRIIALVQRVDPRLHSALHLIGQGGDGISRFRA